MVHKITDECISCGICEPECPNEAISEGEDVYIIDLNLCNECADTGGNPACIECCPVEDAIVKL
jgi:ferredoxin